MWPAGDLGGSWCRAQLKKLVRVYGIGYSPRADVRLALTISATKSSRMQQGSLHARRCPPPSPYDGERRERERVMIGLWRLMHSRWSIYNNVTFFGLPRHGELLAGLFLAVCVYFCGVTASKQKIVILLPLLPELDSGP